MDKKTFEVYESSVHCMLYILNKADKELDFHKIFKIMYFAEQKHLAKYGRMITQDRYIKMPNGPVPSYAYSVFQFLRDGKQFSNFHNFFKISGRYQVKPLTNFDPDEFSVTDIECLDESIKENINLNFSALTDKSHDEAWNKAFDTINIYQMAKSGGASDEMVQYIKHINKLKR